MLTIHINKNASGLVDYFTTSLSKDDYFFSGDSIDGRWHGRLRDELGLPDKVSRKDFSALAHNVHPKTGDKLTVRNVKERRTSIEYTFACPKSVSIIMALSDERTGKEVLNAHRLAVKKAMQEIERDMQTQTYINGRKTYATTGKIIYSRHDHFTSRPVKDQDKIVSQYTSDMHLHSHCVVMNCTSFNGKFQAIEGSTIHRTAEYYEALYHSYLSKSMQNMGFEVMRTDKRWEIKSQGLTRRTIEKFSRRTMEIEQAARAIAQKRGSISAKTKGALGAKLRVNKSKVKENVDLKQYWMNQLTQKEFTAIQTARSSRTISPDPITSQRAIDLAIEHHMERKSAVPTKKLLARALALSYGKLTIDQLESALKNKENILYARKGYLEHMTTREMVRAEDKMIEFASSGKASVPPINPEYKISQEFLNDQQRTAITQILNSTDRIQILDGAAGVGKTTLLGEIKDGAAQKGIKVMAFAPSSGASRDVLRRKGFEGADTIAAFLNRKELQEKAKNQIILIDEASLIGVKTMNKIFDTARTENARVILSGDPRQHSSPEAGDASRILIEKAGLKIAKVDKILRQNSNPALKMAVENLARGEGKTAFAKLEKMGAVIEIEDKKDRHLQLAHDYVDAVQANQSTLVISPTHKEGQTITEAIRAEMKARGRIIGEERSYIIQRPLSFTAVQKKDVAQYETGMSVQFHQNVKGGFKAGQRYRVEKTQDERTVMLRSDEIDNPTRLPMEACDRFEVFRAEQLAVAQGDLIRITRNGKTQQSTRLYNGQVYKVKGFTPQGDIRIQGGRTLEQTFGNFTYGVVQTSHAVQGKDAKAVFVAQSGASLPATNIKQFYVTVSRSSHTLKIYTDDKEALREAITRSGERMTAREIADRQSKKSKVRQRNRQHYIQSINKTPLKDAEKSRQYQRGFSKPYKRTAFEPNKDKG